MSVSTITKEYFIDIADHVRQNGKIADFYEHMFLDGAYDPKAAKQDGFGFFNRSKAIDLCCKWWDVDYYRMQAVKAFKDYLARQNPSMAAADMEEQAALFKKILSAYL